MQRQICCLLILLCLLISFPVRADDVFSVTPASMDQAETDRDYIRISCPAEGSLCLTITNNNGQTVYQRFYTDCDETFQSEDIYLRLENEKTDYTVTVDSGKDSYVCHVIRKPARLENSKACSSGLSLKTVTGKKNWLSVTVLDVSELKKESETYPIYASQAYTLGSVTFSLNQGKLTASLSLPEDCACELVSSSMDVALTAVDAQNLGTKTFHGLHTTAGTPVNVGDADYVCVLLQLRVSYNPDGLPEGSAGNSQEQKTRWENMQQDTRNDSNG